MLWQKTKRQQPSSQRPWLPAVQAQASATRHLHAVDQHRAHALGAIGVHIGPHGLQALEHWSAISPVIADAPAEAITLMALAAGICGPFSDPLGVAMFGRAVYNMGVADGRKEKP